MVRLVCPVSAFKSCAGRVILTSLGKVQTKGGKRTLTVGCAASACRRARPRHRRGIRGALKPFIPRRGLPVRPPVGLRQRRPGAAGQDPLPPRPLAAQRCRGRPLVGREERLDRELGQRDVERGAERRDRGEERQLAAVGAGAAARQSSAARLVGSASGGPGSRQLLEQRGQRRVAGDVACRRRRASRWARHSARFAIRGASPSGCRLTRSTFTGGASSSGATPSSSSASAARWPRPGPSRGRRPRPGTARGRVSTGRSAARTGAIAGVVERALRVGGRVAGREQQRVALAQRHLELLGQVQHQLAAGLRAAGLDEAEVARRDAGLERQVELAEPAPLAPVAQQRAERRAVERLSQSWPKLAPRRTRRPYLGGNCRLPAG